MLIIGTTNKNKFNSIKAIISIINPKLIIKQEKLLVNETGSYAEENSIIKANLYYKTFSNNILCEDESLILTDSSVSPGTRIKRTESHIELSNIEIINKWKNILKYKSAKGILTKSYTLVTTKGELYNCSIKYHVKLIYNQEIKYNTNPLNNFIVPRGFKIPISKFSRKEILSFREKQTRYLTKLLTNLHN